MSKGIIIGCDEMRERGIDTTSYGYNRDPGIHKAVIDLMAEARKHGTLRVFMTFSDGRKIIAPVYWWQKDLDLGFRKRKPGDTVLIEYERIEDGRVFPKSAKSVKDDPGEEDGPYEIP